MKAMMKYFVNFNKLGVNEKSDKPQYSPNITHNFITDTRKALSFDGCISPKPVECGFLNTTLSLPSSTNSS